MKIPLIVSFFWSVGIGSQSGNNAVTNKLSHSFKRCVIRIQNAPPAIRPGFYMSFCHKALCDKPVTKQVYGSYFASSPRACLPYGVRLPQDARVEIIMTAVKAL